MTPEDISTIVDATIADLPERVQLAIDAVTILVVANARDEVLPDGHKFPGDFKGVYIGTVIEGEDDDDTFANPPAGVIYLNAENLPTQDEVVRALYHEIGHVMGLSEKEVEDLGMG